ncbi:hypothetical protein [Arachidicoccus terrestris]|uniref:hypothetical protein n=1 Tax=Arachidicoccus terrestris TaxID=2875539 RepID=UPI001CC41FD6|nr:hypothetical protein [Arachidicoccus terrestris]UAY57181.1 hypothetical protein K9M52_09430 [Arachidicoccus terrestris]
MCQHEVRVSFGRKSPGVSVLPQAFDCKDSPHAYLIDALLYAITFGRHAQSFA